MLALYAALLWRWPMAWLIVVPSVLVGIDLTPWTGWALVGESDLFVLVTVGVLALRTPLPLADMFPRGPARTVIVLLAAAYLLGAAIGWESSAGPAVGSSLPYLRHDNAIRLAKAYLEALALLPFLRHRQQTEGDAFKYFDVGMLAGLTLVAAETFVERASFPGAFDLFSFYPASGPFASMNVGGGHLGAFVAMAFPFTLLRRSRRLRLERNALRLVTLAASYVLIVTFSPLIYGAAALGIAVTFFGRTVPAGESGRRRGERRIRRFALRAVYLLLLLFAAFVAIIGAQFIRLGIESVASSLTAREHSLVRRLALRDSDFGSMVFGMGLGTYPRIAAARSGDPPSNFVLGLDRTGHYLSLTSGPSFYFGQRVPIVPGPTYAVSLSARSLDGKGAVKAILCEKQLLYSQNCHEQEFKLRTAGHWEKFSAPISTEGMDGDAVFGLFRRPVELALVNPQPRTTIDLKDIGLTGPGGFSVANGDFAHGVARWSFTDENHDSWQIADQYVMTLFEGGAFGLAAFIGFVVAALIGARRAMRRGDRIGTAATASMTVFLFLCVFDSPLQAPRLGTVFYLISFIGLLMLEPGTYRGYLNQVRRPWAAKTRGAIVMPIAAGRPVGNLRAEDRRPAGSDV